MADGGEGTLDALGGPNRTTTVTGPLGEPVEARWRLDGQHRGHRDGPASGLELVGGADGQRPDRRLHGRHRRADRGRARSRRHPGDRRRRRLGHHRRRVWPRCGRCTHSAASRASSSSSPATCAPASSRPPRCSRRRRAPRRPRWSCCAAGSSGWPRCTSSEHGVDVTQLEGAGAAGGLAGGLAAAGAQPRRRLRPRGRRGGALRPPRGCRPGGHRRGLPRRPELRGQGRRRGGGAGGGGRRARRRHRRGGVRRGRAIASRPSRSSSASARSERATTPSPASRRWPPTCDARAHRDEPDGRPVGASGSLGRDGGADPTSRHRVLGRAAGWPRCSRCSGSSPGSSA